jgi:hypothetical protein
MSSLFFPQHAVTFPYEKAKIKKKQKRRWFIL